MIRHISLYSNRTDSYLTVGLPALLQPLYVVYLTGKSGIARLLNVEHSYSCPVDRVFEYFAVNANVIRLALRKQRRFLKRHFIVNVNVVQILKKIIPGPLKQCS